MALDVTIKNDFDSGESGKTEYWKKNGGTESSINPGYSTTLSGTNALSQNDNIEIRTGDYHAFQIRFKKISGHPEVQVQLNGSKWKTSNMGTDTQVQVEIGPDLQ